MALRFGREREKEEKGRGLKKKFLNGNGRIGRVWAESEELSRGRWWNWGCYCY